MQIFRSDEHQSHKVTPRTEKKIIPDSPILYLRGLILLYEKNQLHLIFNVPEALTSYNFVYVDLKNLSTGESIPVSQTERQDVVLNSNQRYILAFICSNVPNDLENSSDQYLYEFEPESSST